MNRLKKSVGFVWGLLFFPLILLSGVWRRELKKWKKVLATIGITVLLIPLWGLFYFFIGLWGVSVAQTGLYQAGVIRDEILIAGTGSMYPTFPKGTSDTDIARFSEIVEGVAMRVFPGGVTLGSRRFFAYQLKHGDIVSFENENTRTISQRKYGTVAGFVKRVIGLPGDRIELRNGFVHRNGDLLEEPYTVRARSTYGGKFLPDCRVLEVPAGEVFTLGDNRVASNDSRHDIELIALGDIDHVLPFEQQTVFFQKWRNADGDSMQADEPTLDVAEYVTLLNAKRRTAGVGALESEPRLNRSAVARGDTMLATDDISFEATASGFGLSQALEHVAYRNIVSGESSAMGFLSAVELLEFNFEQPSTREFLLNPDFDDIGIGVVSGEFNGCPAQIIVQHFGGFVPPDYTAEQIISWQQGLDSIQRALPTWEELREFPPIYDTHKADIDRLIQLLRERQQTAQTVLSRMQANQWLTPQERELVEQDKRVAEEVNRLIGKIADDL